MKLRQTIQYGMAAAAVAVAVAVQRDTFVRRWLVPPPAVRPLLDRRVPEIHFATDSFDDAVAHLSRTAGVEIRYEARELHYGDGTGPGPLPPFERTFRGATVDHVLRALVRHWRPWLYVGSMTSDRGGAIRVGPHWPDGKPLGLRVYDVTDLVPPPDPPLVPDPVRPPYYNLPAGIVTRAGALDELQDHLRAAANVGNVYYRSDLGPVPFPAGVFRRGTRFFVMTDAESHRDVADLLAAARADGRTRDRLLGVGRP